MTIRLGFYGAGLITGMHTYLLGRARVEHRIVAVHDPDPLRATAFAEAHGAQVAGEDELLHLVDAVYVCTWTSEHARLVGQAARAGKAVFCEKPLAFDAGQAQAMADAVAGAGVVNQVGLILRSSPPFRWVRHLLADERAGKPLGVVFRDDQYLPVQGQYASTWRADAAKAGHGVLLEHSIHDVDILQWWLGPVDAVSAATREHHALPGIEDVCSARFDFASGATATLLSVWHDMLERPSLRSIEVFTERLYVAIDHDLEGPVRWQFAGEAGQSLQGRAITDALRRVGDRGANPAQGFLAAVRDGTAASPDFAAALPAHRIVDALYQSADEGGGLVRLPS